MTRKYKMTRGKFRSQHSNQKKNVWFKFLASNLPEALLRRRYRAVGAQL